MKHGLILFGVLGLLCQNLVAGEDSKTPFEVLKTTPLFAIGGVGYAGTITAPEKALCQVVKQKDARLILAKLLNEGTIEGQMYALVGLKTLEDPEFETQLKSYTDKTNQVNTANGCILTKEPASKVAKAIAAGRYKLKSG